MNPESKLGFLSQFVPAGFPQVPTFAQQKRPAALQSFELHSFEFVHPEPLAFFILQASVLSQ
jgi:hypothetical protein